MPRSSLRGGVGAHRERETLERWESGQDRVALALFNCPEYIEAMLGCFRARAVPFNVNQHYRPAEVRDLFGIIEPVVVVYHRRLGPLVAEALPDTPIVLVDVDDDSGVAPLPGSTNFEDACRTDLRADTLPVPSPDDLYMVCTGGTTGRPKGVLWRQADVFVAAMGGSDATTAESLRATALAGGATWFAAPPLMHGAAQWTAFGGMHMGATIVIHDDSQPFDARTIVATAAREKVSLMSIVGDAYTRPIVEELQRGDYDLSSLLALATGGAATNERYKEALVDLLPHVTIIDGYGASETGGMAFGTWTRDAQSRSFAPALGAAVLSADRSRYLQPGEDETGWTARRGRVPLAYLNDREATERTFPVIDGQRVSVPGDRARLEPDGRIVMLGRDSMVVNTGGEKVYVEEVEGVLRQHPDVLDAIVVGRPSDRFGQEVVAVVKLRDGAVASPADLREFVAASLARFKAPRAIVVVDLVPRLANGKADYASAKVLAEDAVNATT